MGYWTSSKLNVIILVVSFKLNLNFKIQMLTGNSLKMCIGVSFEISSTLVISFVLLKFLEKKYHVDELGHRMCLAPNVLSNPRCQSGISVCTICVCGVQCMYTKMTVRYGTIWESSLLLWGKMQQQWPPHCRMRDKSSMFLSAVFKNLIFLCSF